ncbi:hypothetical protein GGQ22_07215 [Nocardioides sp. zg-579]|uniref:Uncharacterized protein n=1 Tax=Nocardioides marmotae TaxID=2663857 RepID=A0A6I3J1E8_9ACTN|nr:hypothetical protein [Nocardioides marmotae]MCR6031233.1 hypothetical protein [Gordonia jinghuaiqii]MTB94871.1 hypothetical protein [Nocardioides marmotae]QKE01150.1 hypothetical protein HPC71_08765 [Nocardioides marmotae]
MTDVEELVAAVRRRAEGTPYVVTETPSGFDVQIDIADASWYALLYKEHLSRTWIYHVKVEDGATKTLSITDDVRTVDWRVGAESRDGQPVPVLGGSLSRQLGRVESQGFQKVYATNEHGEYAKVLDIRFDSAEGRDLIRGPARELGWTEKRGLSERIGLYVGVSTLVMLVLGGLVVAIVALTVGF